MAIEFLRAKSTHGGNAKLCDYILRNGQFSEKEDFISGGCGNLPSWAESAHDFWLACDQFQKAEAKKRKKDEKEELKIKDESGKHIIVALPKEFNNRELEELGEKIAQKIAGDDHAFVYGIHVNTGVLSNDKNPHLHVFLSNRKIEPEREEPDRETYFKKSRTLKTGGISGGYRKDVDITGTHRTQWLELKKKEMQDLTNAAILEHNKRTGENVPKIDFKARKGSKAKHIGNTDIAYAVRHNSAVPKIQKELDRRISEETRKQSQKVIEAEKIALKKATKLSIVDGLTVALMPFIEHPLNAVKRAKNREKTEMALRRAKLNVLQEVNLSTNRRRNIEIAENRILKKQENFNAGLKAEAEKRGLERTFEYHAENKAIENAENRRKEEEERKKAKAKAEADRKAEEERRRAEREEYQKRLQEQEKIRQERQKNAVKVKKQERGKGYSR